MKKQLPTIIAILTIIGMFFAGFFVLDSRHAGSEEFRQLKTDYSCYRLEQRYHFLLKLVRDYEKEYGQNLERADSMTKAQYEKAKADLRLIWEKMKRCSGENK